jgi:hypothetical protein
LRATLNKALNGAPEKETVMSSNVSIFPALGRRIPKSKARPDCLPLHSDERLVLETYLGGGHGESPEVLHACDRLEIPQNVECTRLAAAVGRSFCTPSRPACRNGA